MSRISNFKNTLEMKFLELKEIRDEFLPDSELPEKLDNHDVLISIKNSLYRHIQSDSFKNIKFPVTNVEILPQDWYGIKLNYFYARQAIGPLNPLKVIFAIEGTEEKNVSAYFTTCCQSANWSVLYTVWKSYALNMFENPNETFFETAMILRHFNLEQNGEVDNIIYVDSSSETYDFPAKILEEQICIVDTTCIYKGNKELNDFIIKSLKKNWKVILTRSHLKLDSLGVEYCQLGTITILNEDQFPTPKNDPNFNFNEPPSFKMALRNVISNHSYFARIDMIYPFLGSSMVNKLISKKEERLIKNYNCIMEELDKNKTNVTYHKNKIFITFETDFLSNELSEFLKIKNKYITSIREKIGFPIYYSDSFGFDFCSVTAYSMKRKSGIDGLLCRISIGDIDENDLKDSVSIFSMIIKKLRSK